MNVKKYELVVDENRIPHLKTIGETNLTDRQTCQTPGKIVDIIRSVYQVERLLEEHVYMLALDVKMHPLGLFELSHGTTNTSSITPDQALRRALLCGANSFCIAHNHPSGEVAPSADDDLMTARLAFSAKFCNVNFLDHVIIAGANRNAYFSYLESSPVFQDPQSYL